MDFQVLSPLLPTLKPSEQIIFLNLYSRAVNNEVIASQANLVAWSGIKSRNTIKSALRALIDRGLLRVLKPGQESSSAIYLIGIHEKPPEPEKNNETSPLLTSDDQIRLAAIKRSLSPSALNEIKRNARISNETEEMTIIRRYFGPGRIHRPNP